MNRYTDKFRFLFRWVIGQAPDLNKGKATRKPIKCFSIKCFHSISSNATLTEEEQTVKFVSVIDGIIECFDVEDDIACVTFGDLCSKANELINDITDVFRVRYNSLIVAGVVTDFDDFPYASPPIKFAISITPVVPIRVIPIA